jgi:predicted DNA-binding transcriptional regulator AlpA
VKTKPDLRLTEVAQYLGVSKQRAHQLAGSPGFPSAARSADGRRAWTVSDIEEWAHEEWWGVKPWRRPLEVQSSASSPRRASS